MATKKKAPGTSSEVIYQLGIIETKLEMNDDQHKMILENLEEIKVKINDISRSAAVVSAEAQARDAQHRVILDKVSILCAALEPIHVTAAKADQQIEINQKKIEELDEDIHGETGLKTKIDSMVAKASIIGGLVSIFVAAIFYFGKLFISHLVTPGTLPPIGP